MKENEIDLLELGKFVWSKKWRVAKISFIFALFGLFFAFTSPKEYTASATLIPEAANQEGELGGSLGGLASLAGVDLGGLTTGVNTINPALYQSVSRSTPFLLEVLNQSFFFEEVGDELTIFDYYENHHKLGFLGRVLSIPGIIVEKMRGDMEADSAISPDDGTIALTKFEQDLIEDLQTRIFVELDWELNLVNIQVEMQDPVVAAKLTKFTQEYIRNYVSDYAISKGQFQLSSIEEQYQERKKEFEVAQLKLARFRDKNQNVTTAQAKSEEERLSSEYSLAFNIYNQLAQQREAIKLQIQESTPVFTVLEPVKVPVEKSKPRRLIITIMFVFVGVAIILVYYSFVHIKMNNIKLI